MSQAGQPVGRRGRVVVAGVVVLVGLIGAGVALWFAGGERRADNVATFARAPVGCETTLDFEATGTFVIYVETTGEFTTLAGACDVEPRYDREPDDVPELDLTLLDPSGKPLAVFDAEPVVYDVDGFIGTAVYSVRIDMPGDHVLTVGPIGGDPFAIAIGRSPDEGVALLRWGAAAAAIAGLVLGGVLLVLGSRRAPTPASPTAPWAPDEQGWPASPPGFPTPPPTTGAVGPPLVAPPAAGGPVPSLRPAADREPRSPWAPPPPPSS